VGKVDYAHRISSLRSLIRGDDISDSLLTCRHIIEMKGDIEDYSTQIAGAIPVSAETQDYTAVLERSFNS
jgi:hypothetical protein